MREITNLSAKRTKTAGGDRESRSVVEDIGVDEDVSGESGSAHY